MGGEGRVLVGVGFVGCRAKLYGITTKPFTCSMAKSLKLPNRQVKGSRSMKGKKKEKGGKKCEQTVC